YLSVCLSARLADAYISEFRLGRKITFLKCLASVPMLQALTFWFCIRRIGEFPSPSELGKFRQGRCFLHTSKVCSKEHFICLLANLPTCPNFGSACQLTCFIS
ncbi:MAG: hypothetical protein RMK18_12515, partial [Armatimonadota bacterium]|nr:hypothetical protein [Armatimonadota bacterium]